ncbi:MAG: 16S rRNA (uracil(1498)-N(3))-methyltransferase [Planctomycetota bacterium]
MALPWFFHDPVTADTAVTLDPLEARHATGSRRLRAGSPIVLCDGRGTTATAELTAVERRNVTAWVQSVRHHQPPTPQIHVASAVPKGDRAATMLGFGTQLGLDRYTPLSCERSVVEPSSAAASRWERVVREASKQCQRPYFPELSTLSSIPDLLQATPTGHRLLLLDPDGSSAPVAEDPCDAYLLIVGPEGGFTIQEKQQIIDAGASLQRLAPYILRTETAVAAAISVVSRQQRFETKGDLG